MASLFSPRERVVQSALKLFYLEGFHVVGTNRICFEAGVNKSTLYHLFPSKVDILMATMEVYADEITQKFRKIAASDATAEQRLEKIFETPFHASCDAKKQFTSVKGCLIGNMALEMSGAEERVRIYLVNIFQVWAETIEPIVADLLAGKSIDTLKAAISVITYLQGVILMSKVHNDPQMIKDSAKSALALLF
jgi:TetR/AcrR family transcriptional regulator, transcriptional repressor for nem operon